MATDYYKYKILEIRHKTGIYYIPLTRERGYYYEHPYDSDEEDYYEKVEAFKQNILESTFQPILIYSKIQNPNRTGFVNSKYREKYEKHILDKIYQPTCFENHWYFSWKDTGKIKNMDDVLEIYKVEKRERRHQFKVNNPYIRHIKEKKAPNSSYSIPFSIPLYQDIQLPQPQQPPQQLQSTLNIGKSFVDEAKKIFSW